MKRNSYILTAVVALSGLVSCDQSIQDTGKIDQNFYICVSDTLSKEKGDELMEEIHKLFLDQKWKRKLVLVDAWNLRKISELERRENTTAVRDNVDIFQTELDAKIKPFFDKASELYEAAPDARERLRIPETFDKLTDDFRDDLANACIVVVGSKLYLSEDQAAPNFSMIQGDLLMVPTDGNLTAKRGDSPYWAASAGQSLGNSSVLMVVPRRETTPAHEAPIRRFWSLFCEMRGGELRHFSDSIPNLREPPELPLKTDPLRADDRLVGMRSIEKSEPVILLPPSRPSVTDVDIVIEWSAPYDLDLACLYKGEELSLFKGAAWGHFEEGNEKSLDISNPQSEKALREARDSIRTMLPTSERKVERIKISDPVELDGLEIFINFSSGEKFQGVVECELQVRVEGKLVVDERVFFASAQKGLGRFIGGSKEPQRLETFREAPHIWQVFRLSKLVKFEEDSNGR